MSISETDFTRPSVTRVYDYLLGGRDNFAADRELAGRLLEIYPSLRDVARENQAFIARAVTWAAQQGIGQFADLGTGMPGLPSVGDAARAVIPDARIAYVDNDPIVIAIVRALLADDKSTAAVDANLADPPSVLADQAFRAVINPAEPVCLILGLVLNLMSARQARQVVAGYANLIAPASWVVISCGRCNDEALCKQLSETYTAADIYNHSPREVESFLGALESVPPGLAVAQGWRGGWHDARVTPPSPAYVLAGVACKK